MGDGVGEMDVGTEGWGSGGWGERWFESVSCMVDGRDGGRTEGCMVGWVWDCGAGKSGYSQKCPKNQNFHF